MNSIPKYRYLPGATSNLWDNDCLLDVIAYTHCKIMNKTFNILFYSSDNINLYFLDKLWYISPVGYNLHVCVDLVNGVSPFSIMNIYEPYLEEVAKELVIKHNSEVILDLPKTPIEELMNIYFLNH